MRPESWATFVGFLAGRQAAIYAQVKEHALTDWAERYMDATGGPLPAENCGLYQVVEAGANKWACAARVTVKADMSDMLLAGAWSALPMEVNIIEGPAGVVTIHSEDVVWRLFHAGFALGCLQDVVRIRDLVPGRLLEHFDRGVEVACG